MEIQEFVRESLCQIVEGINAARKRHEGVGTHFMLDTKATLPRNVMMTSQGGWPVYLAEFDLAVTTTDKTEASGKVGISIAHVFSGGGGKSATDETVSATRIKFCVPISYKPVA